MKLERKQVKKICDLFNKRDFLKAQIERMGDYSNVERVSFKVDNYMGAHYRGCDCEYVNVLTVTDKDLIAELVEVIRVDRIVQLTVVEGKLLELGCELD